LEPLLAARLLVLIHTRRGFRPATLPNADRTSGRLTRLRTLTASRVRHGTELDLHQSDRGRNRRCQVSLDLESKLFLGEPCSTGPPPTWDATDTRIPRN